MDKAILTSVIAAGSALSGIILKMTYDAIIESFKSHKEKRNRFIEERKLIYDEFLEANKDHVAYLKRLQEVTLIARAGKQLTPEVMRDFPESSMPRLVEALEKIRRIAYTHEIVKIAERIVSLHGDASGALRYYLSNESLMYGLPLFLVNRLGEDQVREFIAAYRKDLGMGAPKGGPETFPIIHRDYPIAKSTEHAEEILRIHLKADPHATGKVENWPNIGNGKPLVDDDAKLLETPEFRSMILDGDSSSDRSTS